MNEEALMEELGVISDSLDSVASAIKKSKPTAPIIQNHIAVPPSKVPDIHNHIAQPDLHIPAPNVSIIHPMWKGSIKVVRHANGMVDRYDLIPSE